MKILSILILIFAASVFSVSAQLCGTYGATLIIRDEANKPVENVEIKIVPLQADDYTLGRTFVRDNEDASRFRVQFNEGYFVKGKYKIVISARGFSREEKEIIFLHCERQTFEFRLKAVKAVTQTLLSGTVVDSAGAAISDVLVALSDYRGKSFSAKTDDYGNYSLSVPSAKYSMEFSVRGFLTTKVENYQLAPTGMTLDVVLEVDMESKTTIYSEMVCEPSKVKKNEQECKYVSRSGNGTGKPTNLTFQTVKKTNTKLIKRKNK